MLKSHLLKTFALLLFGQYFIVPGLFQDALLMRVDWYEEKQRGTPTNHNSKKMKTFFWARGLLNFRKMSKLFAHQDKKNAHCTGVFLTIILSCTNL